MVITTNWSWPVLLPIPMIVTILGVCGIRITWILTVFQIPRFHTPQSLYLSYTISWTFTAAILIPSFLLLLRKRTRQLSPA